MQHNNPRQSARHRCASFHEAWRTPASWVWASFFALSPNLGLAQSVQTDWVGGPGELGPVAEWTDQFQVSNNIAWRTFNGQLALASTPLESPPMHIIAGNAEHPDSVAVGDIDGDGRNDIVSPDYVTDIYEDLGAIYWWRLNEDGEWEMNYVDDTFYAGKFVATFDVDLDGDLDVLAAAGAGPAPDPPGGLPINGRFAWFENLNGDGSAWAQHVVGELFNGARYMDAGDLDGDGDIDLVGASELTKGVWEQDADIAWFENLDGNGENWALHELENEAGHGWEVHIGDINGDGALDVVSCEDDRIAWFDNVNGDGSFFLKRIVSASLNSVTMADIGDVDHDGDMDILGGSYGTGQVAWWDNITGTGAIWFPRYVVTASRIVAVDLADADGDGDLDVLLPVQFSGGAGAVYWIEHVDGSGIVWNPVFIDDGFHGNQWCTFGDVNTDNLLDAVCCDEDFDGHDSRQLVWFALTEFVEEGDLVSTVLDGGANTRWGEINWDASLDVDQSLIVQVRASDDPFNLGPFAEVSSSGQYLSELIDPHAQYIQYRLVMGSSDPNFSPIFHELAIAPAAAGDFDADGDVDWDDYDVFADCLGGPEREPDPAMPIASGACLGAFDADLDDDVDLDDFADFCGAFSGQ
jgi:hypothetical protein